MTSGPTNVNYHVPGTFERFRDMYRSPAGEHACSKRIMAVALLTIELYLPLNDSLKGKRSILKPLIARLRRDFNVSVCEADQQDAWTRATLEVACVSQTAAVAHRQLQLVANQVESWRLDAQLVDYSIEMLG